MTALLQYALLAVGYLAIVATVWYVVSEHAHKTAAPRNSEEESATPLRELAQANAPAATTEEYGADEVQVK